MARLRKQKLPALYIFDFDDTLATTNSQVRVVHSNGSVTRLDSRAFAMYEESPGEELDFSEFEQASGKLILDTISAMDHAINQSGIENVFIVTARSTTGPVREFLSSMGIKVPAVIATTGSPGKAVWLANQLESNNYDVVFVYEDCRKNITMLEDVVKTHNKKLGKDIIYSAVCILPDGKQEVFENTLRTYIRNCFNLYF
jgi:hypothetical protein